MKILFIFIFFILITHNLFCAENLRDQEFNDQDRREMLHRLECEIIRTSSLIQHELPIHKKALRYFYDQLLGNSEQFHAMEPDFLEVGLNTQANMLLREAVYYKYMEADEFAREAISNEKKRYSRVINDVLSQNPEYQRLSQQTEFGQRRQRSPEEELMLDPYNQDAAE